MLHRKRMCIKVGVIWLAVLGWLSDSRSADPAAKRPSVAAGQKALFPAPLVPEPGWIWGYIDKTGRAVIRPIFKRALRFAEGLAAVQMRDGKWGFIDTTGKVVIAPRFGKALGFSEGLAPVQTAAGKFGYLNKAGSMVIPPRFDTAERFRDGLAWVEIGEMWGYIDKAGRFVWKRSMETPGGHIVPGRKRPAAGGPRTNFFGIGGNAHNVVYLIDRSGSMVETFDVVRKELLISISRLRKEQDFHLVLLDKGTPKEPAQRRLVSATPSNKETAAAFLEGIRPVGVTDPIPALKRAFAVLAEADAKKPGKLIFLLTDGSFPDNAAVLKALQGLNKQKTVQINTYLMGSPSGRRDPDAEKTLSQIAKDHNGRYTFLSQDE